MYYLRNLLFTVLLLVFPCISFGQGVIMEGLLIESEILGKDVSYSVYLPEGYDTSERNYPVLYLLHGFTDDETGWVQFGEIKNIADRETKGVDVTPMIIVMPDAGLSWYVNSYDGSLNYEDFFFDEFLPQVEQRYRIRSEKQFRAIAGLSMGGHGALVYAMKHPTLFAASAPLSAGVSTDAVITETPMERWNNVYGLPFGQDLEGKERLTEHYRRNSVLSLLRNGDTEQLKKVRYYIDCGDDDFLIKGNMALHAEMLDKGIPHEFRVRDGAHTWTYWRTAMPEVLRFVSQSFHR